MWNDTCIVTLMKLSRTNRANKNKVKKLEERDDNIVKKVDEQLTNKQCRYYRQL